RLRHADARRRGARRWCRAGVGLRIAFAARRMSSPSTASMLELERIEREAWADLASVMPAPLALGIGLRTAEIGRAYLFMASKVPQFQFNWLSGAGLNGDDGTSI